MSAVVETEGAIVSRLDPRTRLVATLVFIVTVVGLSQHAAIALAVLAAGMLAVSNPSALSDLKHRLLHVEGFMIVLLLMLPLSVPGRTLLAFGPLSVSAEGLARALEIVLKVNAAALVVAALIGTLDPVHLGHAMARLGLPQPLVHLFLFSVRYVAVFRDETRRLREAMRARAFRPGSNLHTWRTYGNLAGMILVRSLARADRVDEAMRARGYAGRLPLVLQGRYGPADAAFMGAVVLACAALVVFDRTVP